MDSGSNVSTIHSKFVKSFNLKLNKISNLKYKSVDSTNKFLGRVTCLLSLGYYNLPVNLFVIQNCKKDLIIGLDLIKSFKLTINPNLTIFQDILLNNQIVKEEIYSNLTDSHSPNLTCLESEPENTLNEDVQFRNSLKELIQKFHLIFAQDKYDVGIISTEKCLIELNSHTPINLRPYRCSQKDQDILQSQIDQLLQKGLIRKSNSPYAFPVTLVKKKDEGDKTRLCVDFRKLNAVTLPDNYPFPRIEDIIDKLRDDSVFTILDLCSGFWHVRMHPKEVYKTAFITQNNHYEWLVMPFGFRNAPAVFQRVVHNLLEKHSLSKFTQNYLDNILVHSKNPSEHLEHLEKVFNALKQENIKLKLSKCQFAQRKVNYLGHTLTKNQIVPLCDNTKSIKNFPTPTNVKSLQKFLRKVNFYHKFISNAPKVLAPLYRLLQKNQTFKWDLECQKSFDQSKNLLMTQPVLAIYNPSEHCYLYTDASKVGLGAVLKQKQSDGQLHLIGYFSKKNY